LFSGGEFSENARLFPSGRSALRGSDGTAMSTTMERSKRPQFRNIHVTQILGYRLPAGGIASVLHRASGAVMFLALPLLLWLFDLSLTSEISYARLSSVASHWLTRLVLLGLTWALLHHLVTGIRHVLLDLHVGIDRQAAARSALVIHFISLPLTLLAGLKLFGVL
jgi:succinate dehydrogenase / fumarate reductase cytochrome b subunit